MCILGRIGGNPKIIIQSSSFGGQDLSAGIFFSSLTPGAADLGGAAAAAPLTPTSVCPTLSPFFGRALKYSSKAAPILELGTPGLSHSVGGAVPRRRPRAKYYAPIFIKRKAREDVAGGIGLGSTKAAAESRDLDDDLLAPGPDPLAFVRICLPLREDPAQGIAQFSLEVCSNQTLTVETRCQAITAISRLAKRKAGSLEKCRLVNPILQVMFPLLAESTEEEDYYWLLPRVAASARDAIKTMALNLPEQVFSPVVEFASIRSQDTNPRYREAAVSALGAIAEGCSRQMKGELEPLLDIVLVAHRHADPRVREAASDALHRFAQHLQPEMVSQCQIVLPCILDALDDDDRRMIKWNSYASLIALCDNMTGEEILPFLDPIMSKLLSELQCRCYDRQKRSLDAICSVAAAAGQGFVRYAERVLESMKPALVLISTEDDDILQKQDFVIANLLATAVGRPGVEPMLAAYIETAISRAASRWNKLPRSYERSHTYGFFCNAAETLGDGFAKYLPGVVPMAFSSCNLKERATHGNPELTSIDIAELDEKAAATQALGLFAVHTKSFFAPYLEESMSIMINHSAHYHEDIRLHGVIGLKNVLTAAQAVSESHSDGAAKAKEVLGTVMNIYSKAMDEDGDKRVVAQVCANLVGILEDFGYAALEPYMPQIIDSASWLLQGQSACQRADGGEHDETLMAAVSNLLPALAKGATTPHFILSMVSMLSDALIKLSAARGYSRYRTTAAAIRAKVAHHLECLNSSCP